MHIISNINDTLTDDQRIRVARHDCDVETKKKKIEIQIDKNDFTNDVNDEYVLMNDFHIKTIKSSKSQRQTISSYTRSFEWQ